jgi:hypothetical protein
MQRKTSVGRDLRAGAWRGHWGVTALLTISLGAVSQAADIHVNPGESIQAAIDAAATGDHVILAPGTYQEQINFNGKAITVRSSDGPEVTTIDATGLGGSTVSCVSQETWFSVLEGLSITGGTGTPSNELLSGLWGGGMYARFSSPTVRNCRFHGNSAEWGAGIGAETTSIRIEDCLFENNEGQGVLLGKSSGGRIDRCVIRGNHTESPYAAAGLIIYEPSGSEFVTNSEITDNVSEHTLGGGAYVEDQTPGGIVHFVNCTFQGNVSAGSGGGLSSRFAEMRAVNCVFANNSAGSGGGGIHVVPDDNEVQLLNCSVGNNTAGIGGGVSLGEGVTVVSNSIVHQNAPDQISQVTHTTATVQFSNVQGGWAGAGIGNVDLDPQWANDLLWLSPASPMNAGNNTFIPPDWADLDDDGNSAEPTPFDRNGMPRVQSGTVDMGAYESANCPFDDTVDCNGNGVDDVCDIAYGGLPDCNGNLSPDTCEADFDGDDTIDACDDDIDNDGVLNENDVCDFTPVNLPLEYVEADGSVLGDFDGDCDVDLADHQVFQLRFTGPGL